MAKTKVAINGFGRIGRLAFRLMQTSDTLEVVAINDLTDNNTLLHLLRYDTAHGKFDGTAEVSGENEITVNGKAISATSIAKPAELPWAALGVDIVLECTGRFLSKDLAQAHIDAGAKKVVLSAPAKGEGVKMIVLGVNEGTLDANDTVVSNASCTTNCLAPMVKVLNDSFGMEEAFVTTTHAYTADQSLQDAPHKDLRRARAAAQNIIPTATGAGKAINFVIPEMAGKIGASALRVPVIDGSVTELNGILKTDASVEEINNAFKTAANGPMKGILEFVDAPLVSSDIIGNSHSSIFDSQLTQSRGKFVRILSWYDNEFGYSNRIVQLTDYLATL